MGKRDDGAAAATAEQGREATRDGHLARFYRSDEELLERLARFELSGLRRGSASAVIATRAHLEALLAPDSEQAALFAAAHDSGLLQLLDASTTLAQIMVDDRLDRARFTNTIVEPLRQLHEQHGRIIVFAEMGSLLCRAARADAAFELERLWTELTDSLGLTLLCAYLVSDGAQDERIALIERICAEHAEVEPALPLQPARVTPAVAVTPASLQRSGPEYQAQLAAIVESSDDAIVSLSLEGRIRSWNDSAARMYGWSAEEAIGASMDLIVPPELRGLEQYILETLARGRHIRHFETTRLTRSGERIPISLSVSPVRDARGAVIGAAKIGRDIGPHRRQEAALEASERRLLDTNRALNELERVDRLKDEFLAVLGHELRNPLATIYNAGVLLSRAGPEPDAAQTAATLIQRQARQLTRLVDELLDLARIRLGRIGMKPQRVELAAVVAQAIESAGALLHQKQHGLAVVAAPGPLYVNGDPERLAQCVGNLVVNAAKYTDPGGHIRVETKAEGDCAVIEVTDDGCGIDPALLPHIFEPFVQEQRTRRRAMGGLGIGLPLVRRIAELHGGSVDARSGGPGQGATFQVRLPLAGAPTGHASGGAPQAAPRPRRVLIVDDDEDGATSLAMLLRLEGHAVLAVHSAHEALARITEFAPDVALLDIAMPDMDGYELLRRLRAMPALRSVRFVAVSGYGRSDNPQTVRGAGFDDHLLKPVTLERLARSLDSRAVATS